MYKYWVDITPQAWVASSLLWGERGWFRASIIDANGLLLFLNYIAFRLYIFAKDDTLWAIAMHVTLALSIHIRPLKLWRFGAKANI